MGKTDRSAIIALFQAGKRQCEIVRDLGVPRQTVSKAIKRFRELGHIGDRSGRGRKRSVRTPRNRQVIKKRVNRNSRVSMRKIARETGISDRSVRRMAKEDLRLKPYKLQRAQLLTDKDKNVRLTRSRALLRRAAGDKWERILFTNEKLFTIEQAHNRQNDRFWSTEAPGSSAIVTHRQFPQSVMVWAGVCSTGKTPLVFVKKGVKVNSKNYREDILEPVVLPWAQNHFGN